MSEISSSTGKILALSMLSGVGPVALRKASRVFGFEDKTVDQLGTEVPAIARAIAPVGAWSKALEQAEKQAELAEQSGARILCPMDSEYPQLLALTKDDPFLLWVRGELAPFPDKSVAIIGTREPTHHGEVITKRITQFFVEQRWSVVSGLALGCDAIAHRTTIEAGGHTVAVLAHGLQTVAPKKHIRLAEEIVKNGGALVSQYPMGREAIPQQFVQRDRTQAGMSQGVVMIQSDLQGGSLHASRSAIDYGRWLAVPYPTEADRTSGAQKAKANLLLAEGTLQDRMKLLNQKEGNLEKLFILRSKDDYARCLSSTAPVPVEAPATQGSMF